MNLSSSIVSNFKKISHVFSHASSYKNRPLKSVLKLWTFLLHWNEVASSSKLQHLLSFCQFRISVCENKLLLRRNNILGHQLKFENDLNNLQPLVIKLEHISFINGHYSHYSLSLKLEDYGDKVTKKENSYFLAGYCKEEHYLKFCIELILKYSCNVSQNIFVSSITKYLKGDKLSKRENYRILFNHLQQQLVFNSCENSLLIKSSSSSSSDGHIMDSSAGLSDILVKNKIISYSGKPPNVLVYTGSDVNDCKKFEDVRSILLQCLARDRYAIYHLRNDQVTSSPWKENTILLVLAAHKIAPERVCESFLGYFFRGGSVMSLSSNFDENFFNSSTSERKQEIIKISYRDFHDVNVFGCSGCYEGDADGLEDGISIEHLATNSETGSNVISQVRHQQSDGVSLLSLVSFEKDASDKSLTEEQFVALKLSNPSRINMFRELLTTIGLNCSQSHPPSLSPLFLHATSQKSIDRFFSSIKKKMKDDIYPAKEISYEFLSNTEFLKNQDKKPCETYLPIIKDAIKGDQLGFDFETYDKNLATSTLGTIVLFGSVIATTMDIIENFMDNMSSDIGLVAIASSQTAGIGRGGNVWLSPKGCALFSLHVIISLDSPLGNCISCFQQIVALASVLAVRTKTGFENIDLRIKWPNDVYYGNKLKLGGVLVKSTITSRTIHINLGCGVNISNKDPTTCLNDIIMQHNNSHANPDDHLEMFTVEEFVARLITQIELLVNRYQEDCGESFYELYHEYWLHSYQEINLYKSDGPKGTILGITREGYLMVRLKDGHLVEVHPDGNSFDMMKNLIISKLHF